MRRYPSGSAPWEKIVVPAAMDLDLGGRGDALDILVVERVERRVVAQEVGDLGRPGGGQPLARAALD